MAIIKPTLNLVAGEYTPDIINTTRASSATRVNAAGLVERVGSGTLRYDHDPTTFAGKGWLIEEARTNLCLQSEDFGTTWAVITTVNITTNTTTAPDGNTTADTMTLNSTTDHPVFQGLTIANNSNDVTNSIFVKQPASGGLTEVRLQVYMYGGTAKDGYCNYVFATGVASAVGQVDSVTVTEFPDGWFRITATMANNSTGNTGCRLSIYRGGTSETGDVYIWGGQMEAGSFPTSYIPTTTAAVTRAQDTPIVNTADIPDFNDGGEGSLYFYGSCPDVSAIGNATWAQLDNGTNAVHRIGFFGENTNVQVLITSTHQYTAENNAPSDNTDFKFAFAWKTNSMNEAFNGTAGTEDTTCTVPSNLSDIQFGNTYGHSDFFQFHIKHFALFPVRLIDADLETITTG